MLNVSTAYEQAAKASVRKTLVKALVDLVDPDVVYGTVTGPSQSYISQPAQLHDRVFELGPSYISLEHNRWILDGSMELPPLTVPDTETGYEGSAALTSTKTVRMDISGIEVLQNLTIIWTERVMDGAPAKVRVMIWSGASAEFDKTYSTDDGTLSGGRLQISGFTVAAPTRIMVFTQSWTLPDRVLRLVEIVPGLVEEWTNDRIAGLSIVQQTDVSLTRLPYSTATLDLDNSDHRFDWRGSQNLTLSLEDRLDIPISLGFETDGGDVYARVGVYFMTSGGWTTNENGLTVRWKLVDLIGLVTARRYEVPDTLPTTLSGWLSSILGTLGVNFASKYQIVGDLTSAALPTPAADSLQNVTCGQLLLWICQALSAWPTTDPQTGDLMLLPLPSEGVTLDLDNLSAYPLMSSNNDIAELIFRLPDQTLVSAGGTSTSSPTSVTITNPFIQTAQQAYTAARMILSGYGGTTINTRGRGDPASQLGDVATVSLDDSHATAGRVIRQTFSLDNGVMLNCQTTLLKAAGIDLYENSAAFTANGSFAVPQGVTQLRIILVGKGEDGEAGTDGNFFTAGSDGADGRGGRIYAGTVNVVPGQTLTVTVGDETTLGAFTSANGIRYNNGYVDINTGRSYGRPGVAQPVVGSGDGGKGGAGGNKGERHEEPGYYYVDIITGIDDIIIREQVWTTITVTDVEPGKGAPGALGATGCAVIYWEAADDES